MVFDRDVAADGVHREVAKDDGEGVRLDPHPQVFRRAEDPHVRLHLALAVEESGVGALAGLERLDVVRQLTLQVLGRILAADHDDAPLTSHGARLLAQGAVLPVDLDRNAHPSECTSRGSGTSGGFDVSNFGLWMS